MRTYDVAIASLAIGAPIRWTDNLISAHDLDGVVASQRGVARRISYPALLVLAAARELHAHLGLSVRDAVPMAVRLLGDDDPGVPASGHVRVTLDRPALERELDHRLREALESAPAIRRGRPPKRRGAGRGAG